MAAQFAVDLVFKSQTQQLDAVTAKLKALELKMAKLQGTDPFHGATQGAGKLGNEGERAGRKIERSFRAATAAAAGLMAALGAALALGKIVSDFRELDANVRRLATAGGDLKGLGEGLRQVSDELGGIYSKAELAKGAYQALSAGFSSTAEALNIVKAASKAAYGGFADQEEVTSVLVKTLNAYGLSASKATQVTDIISKSIEVGNVEWSDYTSQLGKVSGMAAVAGISFQDLNAFIAASTKNGATAEQAFTGLSAMLTTLLQPTKESSDAAASLGIEWNLAGLKAKGLKGLIAELTVAQGKDAETAARMVGMTEGMRGAFAAAANGGRTYTEVLDQLGNASGKTDQDFKAMSASIDAKLRELSTSFKNAGESFMKAFGPAIQWVIDRLKGLLDWMGRVFGRVDDIMNKGGRGMQADIKARERAGRELQQRYGRIGALGHMDERDALIEKYTAQWLKDHPAPASAMPAAPKGGAIPNLMPNTVSGINPAFQDGGAGRGGAGRGGAANAAAQREVRMQETVATLESDLLKARLDAEERLAELRTSTLEKAADWEKEIGKTRLDVERQIEDLQRKLAQSKELRSIDAAIIGDGGISDQVKQDEKVLLQAKWEMEQTITENKRSEDDRHRAFTEKLEEFKLEVTKASGKIQQEYAKRTGEIIEGFNRSAAKILEAGGVNAGVALEESAARAATMLSGAMAAGGGGGGGGPLSMTGVTGLKQGNTGAGNTGPHFHVAGAGSEAEARRIFDPNVNKLLSMTSPMGLRRHPKFGDMRMHNGWDLAGPEGTPLNLASGYTLTSFGKGNDLEGYVATIKGPDGKQYKILHLQKPPDLGRYAGGGLPAANGAVLNENAAKWAKAISVFEGANYNTKYGGGAFNNNGPHPMSGPLGNLTPYGRYQFQGPTWLGANGGQNAPMSQANQDRAFLKLGKGRGVNFLADAPTPENIAKLRNEWSSLPGAAESRGTMAEFLKEFGGPLGATGGGGQTFQAQTQRVPYPAGFNPGSVGSVDPEQFLGGVKAAQAALDQLFEKANQLKDEQAIEQFLARQQELRKSMTADLAAQNGQTKRALEDEQARLTLLRNGVNPAYAEQFVQIDRMAEAERTRLTAQKSRLEKELEQKDLHPKLLEGYKAELAEVEAALAAQGGITAQIKEQIALKEALKNDPGVIMTERFAAAKQELADLNNVGNQVVAGAEAIGSAFSESFKGVISGTMTAQQALQQFFESIAQHFLDMAAQMIAKQIEMQLLGIGLKLLGGGAAGAPGIGPGNLNLNSFAGGGYTGDGPRSGGLDGQGGYLAMLHPQETVVDHAGDMASAMRRYSAAGGRTLSGGEDAAAVGGGGGSSVEVGYRVTEINSIRYVSEEEFRAGLRQAAEQGAAGGHSRVFGDLRNSRSQRARVGMR